MYSDTTEYTNTINLTGGHGALFQFSLVDGETLQGRLAFNGIFRHLSFGFVGPDYPARNAMYGGKVVMVTRGGNYSASEGLDLSLGPQVDEFMISTDFFAFRHWQVPYSNKVDVEGGTTATTTSREAGRELRKGSFDVQMSENLCYTALTFELQDIGGQPLNLTGTDTFMWAANDIDTYMQYHHGNRGTFNISSSKIVQADPVKQPNAETPQSSGRMVLTSAAIFVAMIVGAFA
jgi:hypothetical protein